MNYNDRAINLGEFIPKEDDDLMICRCEEISKGEIRKAIHEGMFTITEIRRFLRTGMGLCQGKTCGKLVRGILANELGVPDASLESVMSRAPMRPVEMRVLANEKRGDFEND